MSIIVLLLSLALLTLLLAPLLLTRGSWQTRKPRRALGLWLTLFVTGVACLVTAMIISVMLAAALRSTANVVWSDSVGIVVVAWGSLFLFGAVAALVLHQGDSLLSVGREVREEVKALSLVIGYRRERFRDAELIVLNTDKVFAYSIAGKPGQIVVSRGCVDLLSEAELAAVLEHEYAHLRQRHAMIMNMVSINAACSPKLAGAVSLKRATALLIELIADDAATAQAGALNLARALRKMDTAVPAPSLLLRARRAEQSAAGVDAFVSADFGESER